MKNYIEMNFYKDRYNVDTLSIFLEGKRITMQGYEASSLYETVKDLIEIKHNESKKGSNGYGKNKSNKVSTKRNRN